MRISHEAIYQALYVQGRGALRRELWAVLDPNQGQTVFSPDGSYDHPTCRNGFVIEGR